MRESHPKSRRVVIVGGGISGLAAAHRLLELQSKDAANSERIPVEVSKRLAPADRITQTKGLHRRSFVVSGGRLRPTPEGFQLLAPSRMLPFITTDIFTWRGKARMALDLLLPRRRGANGSDDESLAAFVRRRLGREALERMAQPMVGGIYTADPESLSLRATMPRFLEMERRHRSLILAMWKAGRQAAEDARHGRGASGARYSLFLSFDEGVQALTDALAARLPEGCVRLNTRVVSLRPEGGARRW